jgi:predicted neuraminidase
MSHCSTLVNLPGEELLAAWMTGEYEPAPDQHLALARRRAGHIDWDRPIHLPQTNGRPEGQPVFLLDDAGTLWLYHVVLDGDDWTSAHIRRRRSPDFGRTWSGSEDLGLPRGWMLRSKPLRMSAQHWLLPAYDETTWRSFMLISHDGGLTWKAGGVIETPPGNIHPCPVAMPGGDLLAFLRTGGRGGKIWRAVSHSGGETWEPATPAGLPNPNSGLDLLARDHGVLVLAFNDSEYERTPLRVALSEDGGKTWPYCRTLQEGPGEFSYPTLIPAEYGLISLTYTHKREYIRYAEFDEAWLREGCAWEG